MFTSRLVPRSRALLAAASAIVIGGALALGGCGGDSGSSDGTTTITFWDNNAGPDFTPLWKHIIGEFEKQNPKIKVKYVGIPIAQVQQKYDTAIAGGGLPDVGLVATSYLADVAGQKALEPLDQRLSASSLNGKLSKNFLDLVKSAGPDGKLYAVPTTGNIGILWYRSDLFAKAKLMPPTTWDAFYNAADKLTDAGHNKFGYTIRGGAGSIAQMLEFMYGQSGVTTIFDDQGKSTINDPRNVAALQKIAALYKKNTPSADVNNDYVKMVAQFDGGSVAMMQHNLGSYKDHLEALGKDKIAGTPVPTGPDGVHVIVSNPVGGTAVFRSGKHKDAAWKFAEFSASAAMDGYWNSQVGQIPANNDVAGQSWVASNPTLTQALKVFNDPTTKVVQLPYYLPQFNSITKTEMEPQYQKVLLGKMSAKGFLDEFAKKFDAAQQQWRQRHGG